VVVALTGGNGVALTARFGLRERDLLSREFETLTLHWDGSRWGVVSSPGAGTPAPRGR
jgi:hypothetical protein